MRQKSPLITVGAACIAGFFYAVITAGASFEDTLNKGKAQSIPGAEKILGTYTATGKAVVNLIENTDATDDGVRRLLLGLEDVQFYNTGTNDGLIGAEDVVLLKINSQWAERGGTNTDLIKSVIDVIVEHPQGFKGEIIIADNGQAMFGSEGKGGRLDWPSPNAKDRKQTVADVVTLFSNNDYKVSGISWDVFTKKKVAEFSAGDLNDGFVVEAGVRPTGIQISYAKFTTKYGTHVSFKYGIWDTETKTYDSDKLRVINMPVLKSHYQYQVSGAVNAYMGVPSDALTGMSAQKSVGSGGMGTLMVSTRFPVLNILDMIYVCPQRGPRSDYATASQKNMIAASTDPFALDFWATKNVLIPEAEAVGYARTKAMSPETNEPGSFGFWFAKSLAEVKNAGIPATTDNNSILIHKIN